MVITTRKSVATIIARKSGTGSVISQLESSELHYLSCYFSLYLTFFRVSCFNTELGKACLVVLVI